jgi:hypothetical protein
MECTKAHRRHRKEPQYELPGDVRAVVIAAWARGGVLPRDAIERMLPVART